MKTYQSYPLTSVTKEDVQNITFYSTEDELRRAAAVKPIFVAPATESLPTLYYREERNPESGEVAYSIHAIDVDVIKFLWMQSIESTESNEEVDAEEVVE